MNLESLPVKGAPGLTLKRIHTPLDLLDIAEIYTGSFPSEERRPMSVMAQAIQKEEAVFWRIVKGKNTIGLLTTWLLPNVFYIEHFAIHNKYRNNGYGSYVLRTVKELFPQPIVLEVEPPTNSIKQRRIEFYLREDFHIVDKEHMQPQYDPEFHPVHLFIVCSDPNLTQAPLKQVLRDIRAMVYIHP